jgi:hypothetical protein
MRPPALLPAAIALLATALIAGCGASAAKRSVDARTEAIRFFPADTAFVALADPGGSDSDQLAEAQRSLTRVPALGGFAHQALGFAAGLNLAPLRPLLKDDDPNDGIAASQVATGLEPGHAAGKMLMVVVSDKSDETAQAVQRIAGDAGMKPAGEKDDAQLYAGRNAAMAVRDGVVLLADSPATLRAAIDLRDGNEDAQLDEGQVNGLLRKLPQPGEIEAYVSVAGLVQGDPGMAALAKGAGAWTDALGHAAISINPAAGGVKINVVAEIDTNAGTPPVGEEPQPFAITRPEVRLARASLSNAGSAFGLALARLAPLAGEVSVNSGDLLVVVRSVG